MKKISAGILFLLTLASSVAFAEIREITRMSQILSSITPDTLVIFDLDNTVMEPPQTLGTDQWFHYLVNKGVSFGLDESQAKARAVPLWASVQKVTPMVPVEKVTPFLIRALQSRGVHVMALTARPAFLAATTLRQLRGIGVEFSSRAPFPAPLRIAERPREVYVEGVALISPFGDKGQALVEFLRQTGVRPGKIVFVDDTPKNVESVERALNMTKLEHVSFRYGYDDAKVKGFDAGVADKEWSVFTSTGRLISDAQAVMAR